MGTVTLQLGAVPVEMIDDDRIVLGFQAKGRFENDTIKVWESIIQNAPDCQVLDVGCYSGLFSIIAAKLGARPIGIEPLPQMQARIKANADLNNVTFRLIKGAACDKTGEVRIGFNDKVPFTSGASLSRKSGGFVMVKAIRLDDIQCDNLAAIKIDVERHEVDVIKGALQLLEHYRPWLIIEALDDDARAAVRAALPFWYRLVEITDTRNMVFAP